MNARLLLSLAFLTSPGLADDWPQWFGPQRDGVWRETGILKKFPAGGPKVLWRTGINQGYAGPAVSGGRVYVMDRKVLNTPEAKAESARTGNTPGNERLVCLDAANGKVIWEQAYDCSYSVAYASGPRATPTVDGDRVYTLGAEGQLFCRSTKDGAVKWSHDFRKLFKAQTQIWGYAAAPLVHGDLLLCLAAGEGSIAVAFDKRTGKEVWRALRAKQPGYCPPRIVQHAGRDLLIIWHPESANALDPATGKVLWSVPWKIRAGLTVPTPQKIDEEHLFFTCFYNGSMLLKLKDDHSQPDIVYRTEHASEKKTTHLHGIINTPVLHESHLYGAGSYGQFRCMEALTGKRVWESLKPIDREEPVRWGTIFVTPHEDRFFLFTERGDLVIAKLSPKGYEEIDRAHVIEPNGVDLRQRKIVWTHPAYAQKCCFIRNDTEVICVSLAE